MLLYFSNIDKFFYNYLSKFSNKNIFYNFFNPTKVENFFRFITKFGEGYFELVLIIALFFFILYNKNKFYIFKNYIISIFFVLIFTQITVNFLKLFFGRARPTITANPNEFYGIFNLIKNGVLFSSRYASFPSGHTITIWGTVWILSFFIKNKFVKNLLFTLGILVGLSRIYLGYHWSTDVITSIVLSYFIAKYIFIYQKIKNFKINL